MKINKGSLFVIRDFAKTIQQPAQHNKNDKWCVMWNIYEKLFRIIPMEMLIRYLLLIANINAKTLALTRVSDAAKMH